MPRLSRYYVAVLTQNVRRPIVYGLGTSAAGALSDANGWTSDTSQLVAMQCSVALFERINGAEGCPECEVVDGVATVVGEVTP